MNWASIVLIPKVATPESSEDYRPISLISSIMKSLSKILAVWLSKVMDRLVDISQSSFLKGRCILDNIATTEELIFIINNCNLSGHILKVNFAKAFDIMNWNFLFDLMLA